MPHREIQEIISAMADRQEISPGQLERVRDHCRRCPECAAFASAVAQVRAVRPPRLPRGLAGRIVATVAEEMDAARALAEQEEADAHALADLGLESSAEEKTVEPAEQTPPAELAGPVWRELNIPWLTRERLWTVMASVGASAAIVLIAVFVSGRLGTQATVTQEAEDAVARSMTQEQPAQGAAPPQGAASDKAQVAAPASAPPFVVFNGLVFSPTGAKEEVVASSLTTAGTVLSALSASGTPATLMAYTRPSDRSIVVRAEDGSYTVCTPVTRRFRGSEYQLTSGVAVARYGAWPRLPTEIPEPTSATGAPTFIAAGTDDLSVRVYARLGGDTATGIAIPPGAPAEDPGGGNPNWTWWKPAK